MGTSLAGKARLAAEVVRTYRQASTLLEGDDVTDALARARAVAPLGGGEHVAYEEGLHLGRAVYRTLRALPRVDSRCLMQSVVLVTMLARRSTPSLLVIAVRPGDEFGAHAWVELDGRPLLPTFG